MTETCYRASANAPLSTGNVRRSLGKLLVPRARLLTRVLLIALCVPAVLFGEDPAGYIVGPKDVLTVAVYGQQQLSGSYTIESDGTFAFPLIGRLKGGDRTLRDIENELRARLAAGYLKDPQVTVSVDQYRSQQVFVMGEVRKPGPLEFTGTMTLLEALARVGSTTEQAGSDALIVRRNGAASALDPAELARLHETDGAAADVVRINLDDLQTGMLSQNVALGSGDAIFVPRAATVFVSGHVRSPGEYVLRKDMNVRQLLSLAGGLTDRGSTRRIQIVRHVDGNDTAVGADLKDTVRAGDTVVVRERFF